VAHNKTLQYNQQPAIQKDIQEVGVQLWEEVKTSRLPTLFLTIKRAHAHHPNGTYIYRRGYMDIPTAHYIINIVLEPFPPLHSEWIGWQSFSWC
jgi:hypothetical protein